MNESRLHVSLLNLPPRGKPDQSSAPVLPLTAPWLFWWSWTHFNCLVNKQNPAGHTGAEVSRLEAPTTRCAMLVCLLQIWDGMGWGGEAWRDPPDLQLRQGCRERQEASGNQQTDRLNDPEWHLFHFWAAKLEATEREERQP